MRVVSSPGELLDDRGDARCYVDQCFLFWGTLGLGGHAVWGDPGLEDAHRLIAAFALILEHPQIHPRALIADFRGLRSVDPAGFVVLGDYLVQNRDRIAALQLREAVLRPDGLVGSIVAGFYEVLPRRTQSRTFTDPGEALAWIGRPEAGPMYGAIEAIQAERSGATSVLVDVRRVLDRHPTCTAVAAAARTVGMSTRSLQRHLGMAGTSFRRELDEARLRRAKLLLATDRKLTSVALELGFSASQHFARWFREQTGVSPSAWRSTARRRPDEP